MNKSWIVRIGFPSDRQIRLNVVCDVEYIMSATATRLKELGYSANHIKDIFATFTSFRIYLDLMP
jgi:gamma-glutamylcysteine synthetase